MKLALLLASLLIIIAPCYCEYQFVNAFLNAQRAEQDCANRQMMLADNNEEVRTLCAQRTQNGQCMIGDENGEPIILNSISGQTIALNNINDEDLQFICGSNINRQNAETNMNEAWDYNNDYNGYNGYETILNPELVCMQYQYYVAISTLIMICFATFICMTIVILNKIKDHQTMVQIRL